MILKVLPPTPLSISLGDDGGFKSIAEEDAFGYLSQGYLYSESENKKFGGWIVINKSTGRMVG